MRLEPGLDAPARVQGSMTAVMRAASLEDAPRVLRVGLVRGGRVVEERLLRRATPITVGSTAQATFFVDGMTTGASHALFEPGDNGTYRLRLGSLRSAGLDVSGRIFTEDAIVDLSARARRETLSFTLGPRSRGRIVVANATILFQFVPLPPSMPTPQLPLGVRTHFGESIDWNLAVLVAMSFLLHFGFVGALLSDWLDPTAHDDIVIADLGGLLDTQRRVAPPEIEAVPSDVPREEPSPAKEPEPTRTRTRGEAPDAPSPPQASRQTSDLAARAERMSMGVLMSLERGPALTRALDGHDLPLLDLAKAAREATGITHGPLDLERSGKERGGVVAPRESHGLEAIARTERSADDRSGVERGAFGPTARAKGDAIVERPESSVPMSDAERVVAGLRPKFRRCYERGLAIDATLSGAVTVITKVAANGDVIAAELTQSSGLGDAVTTCIAQVVMGASFKAPGASGATLRIPVKFVRQSH